MEDKQGESLGYNLISPESSKFLNFLCTVEMLGQNCPISLWTIHCHATRRHPSLNFEFFLFGFVLFWIYKSKWNMHINT